MNPAAAPGPRPAWALLLSLAAAKLALHLLLANRYGYFRDEHPT